MGHQRRYFPSGKPYFISNRVAEGLPFVANVYINMMLYGILARAWSRHKQSITICNFLFMANHYHLILVLNGDPNELRAFMNYVDGEIAKLVARWLGKRNCKIWAQRYCPAILLDSESVLRQIAYTLANPIYPNLAATAGGWTGCSSYYALIDPKPRCYKWVKPSLAPVLPNGRFTKSLVNILLKEIQEIDAPVYELKIEPFAWMRCFPDTARASEDEMKKRLFDLLDQIAKSCARLRAERKEILADPKLLAEQNPHKPYKPKKYARRVFCLSTCKELRMDYIALYKDLCKKAKAAWSAAINELEEHWVPHGMFHPPRPASGSIFSVPGIF